MWNINKNHQIKPEMAEPPTIFMHFHLNKVNKNEYENKNNNFKCSFKLILILSWPRCCRLYKLTNFPHYLFNFFNCSHIIRWYWLIMPLPCFYLCSYVCVSQSHFELLTEKIFGLSSVWSQFYSTRMIIYRYIVEWRRRL